MADIDALSRMLALKDETRTGWMIRGVADPESVAAHTWGTAFLCLLFAEEEAVDVDRCVRMAVVHDLAEAETGDVAYRHDAEKEKQAVDSATKEAEERDVIADLAGELEEERVQELWREYNNRETPEAQFVKDMDLIDMCLQALYYEQADRYDPDADNPHFDTFDHMDEFFATAEPRLSTDTGRQLFQDIRDRYEAVRG